MTVDNAPRESLRIVLDKRATEAHDKMLERLKAMSPFVKVHPSELVSFLVADYFATYFERDVPVVIAEFFDSRAFLTSEIVDDDSDESLKRAMAFIEEVRGKRRGQPVRPRARKLRGNETENDAV